MLINPGHKIEFILSLNDQSLASQPEEVVKVYRAIKGQPSSEEDKVIQEAYNIYNNPFRRYYLEALLFSEIPIPEISSLLELDENIIKEYEKTFFNTSVFKSKIDKFEYFNITKAKADAALNRITKNKETDENEIAAVESQINAIKIMLIYLKFGPKYVRYALGGKDISEEDLANMIMGSIKEAILSAAFNKALNKEREAKDWYRVSSMLISSLKSIATKENKDVDSDPLKNITLRIKSLQEQMANINSGEIIG